MHETEMLTKMLCDPSIRSYMRVLGPRDSIVVTRRLKPRKRASRSEFCVTIGAPNYRARQLLKRAKLRGFDFPLNDIRLYKAKP